MKNWINTNTSFGRVEYVFGDLLPNLKEMSYIGDFGCSFGLTSLELAIKYNSSTVLGYDINESILPKNSINQNELISKIIQLRYNQIDDFLTREDLNLKKDNLILEKQKLTDILQNPKSQLKNSKLFFKNHNIFQKDESLKFAFDAIFMMNNYLFLRDNFSKVEHLQIYNNLLNSVSKNGYLLMSESILEEFKSNRIIFQKDNSKFKLIYSDNFIDKTSEFYKVFCK